MERPTDTQLPTTAALLAALGLALLWGGNSVTIKIGVEGLPPLTFLTVRTGLGLLFLLAWAVISRVDLRPRPGEWAHLVALAALFALQTLGLVVGTSRTLASHSTVLMNTFPFFTALFAHLMIKGDRLTWSTSVGSLLALAGVVVTSVSAASIPASSVGLGGTPLVGDLVVVASAALLGFRTVVSKRMTRHMPPERLLVWMMLLSLPATSVLALLIEEPRFDGASAATIGATLYTGLVISGFGFTAWQLILRKYRASRLTVMFLATPLFGVLLSWLLLGEEIPLPLALAAALVAAGIYIVNSQRR